MFAKSLSDILGSRSSSVRRNTPSLCENLPGIYRRLQEFSQAKSVMADHWRNARPVVLRWDESRQALATDAALETYRAIYGTDLLRGMRHIWNGVARRSRGGLCGESSKLLTINTPLPPDAVVIPQRSQDRTGTPYVLTVVSAREECVVKIFSRERGSRFESELNAWRLAQAAGIAHRLPELIASGESSTGLCWMVSRLVRNSAVYLPVIGDRLWCRFLLAEILPSLERFYKQSGLDLVGGRVWLERFRTELAEHPMAAQLQRLSDLTEAAARRVADDRLPFALIHGDLRPHNVHRYAGQWWLIDWSMSRRAPVMIDLWPNPLKALVNEPFAAWLRGHASINAVPRSRRAPLNTYANWQSSWTGTRLDEDALRFHALTTLLHRLSRNHGTRSPLSSATFHAAGVQD